MKSKTDEGQVLLELNYNLIMYRHLLNKRVVKNEILTQNTALWERYLKYVDNENIGIFSQFENSLGTENIAERLGEKYLFPGTEIDNLNGKLVIDNFKMDDMFSGEEEIETLFRKMFGNEFENKKEQREFWNDFEPTNEEGEAKEEILKYQSELESIFAEIDKQINQDGLFAIFSTTSEFANHILNAIEELRDILHSLKNSDNIDSLEMNIKLWIEMLIGVIKDH